MKALKIAAFLFIIAISSVSFGEMSKFSKQYTITQRIAEKMSIEDTTELALEKIKIKASEEAGAIVVRDEKITGDVYKETISVFGGAFVSLTNITKKVSTQTGGDHYLEITADAIVDRQSLEKRVSVIAENEQLREYIKVKNKYYEDALLAGDVTKAMLVLPEVSRHLAEYSNSEIEHFERIRDDSIVQIAQQIDEKIKKHAASNVSTGVKFTRIIREPENVLVGIKYTVGLDLDYYAKILNNYWSVESNSRYIKLLGAKPGIGLTSDDLLKAIKKTDQNGYVLAINWIGHPKNGDKPIVVRVLSYFVYDCTELDMHTNPNQIFYVRNGDNLYGAHSGDLPLEVFIPVKKDYFNSVDKWELKISVVGTDLGDLHSRDGYQVYFAKPNPALLSRSL